jgi:hypothetical protein
VAVRACNTSDELLFAFVDGLDATLDEHVATCDECQDFLAELWEGELTEDLSNPVMDRIRLAEFVAEVARFGADVAAAMGRGILTYGPGVGERDKTDGPASAAAGPEDTE